MNWFQRLWNKWFGSKPKPANPLAGKVLVEGERFILDGNLFFPISDTAWTMVDDLSDADIMFYLKKRKSQGFTVIKFGVTTGRAFNKTVKKPNTARWDKIQRVLKMMKDLDLWAEAFVGPIVDYADSGIEVLPKSEWLELGRFCGNAMKNNSNIWCYVVDGLDMKLSEKDLKEVAKGLKETDPNRIVAFHPAHGTQHTYDYTYAQSGHKNLTTGNITGLQAKASKTKPWYDGEPCYEHLAQYGVPSHIINASDVARAAKAGIERKAGQSYGSIKVAIFEKDWKSVLDSAGVKEFLKIAK